MSIFPRIASIILCDNKRYTYIGPLTKELCDYKYSAHYGVKMYIPKRFDSYDEALKFLLIHNYKLFN